MNERFWNLKKEKQDRMINAALKIFGKNGYYRACTDEIVKEAGISKGLLFHYFVNKAGVYEFVCNYSIRYMKLELSGLVNQKNHHFFERCREIAGIKVQAMKQYPYIHLFLENACEETKETIGEELAEELAGYRDFVRGLYIHEEDRDQSEEEDSDKKLLFKLAGFVEQGAMKRALCLSECDTDKYPDIYYEDVVSIYERLENTL